ncbi:YciI family protein [Caldimonas sp. KR1-144]|uniref:YciI family protein n=1 Tax=Caldimonas sp. KR1-144 TaxID=3400911 RepID=UPI003C000FF8
MRFMIIVRGNADTEAGKLPEEALLAAMTSYHEELARAGVLLDANGLQPTSKGFRIQYRGGRRRVIDGPFTESKELVAGYTLIEVRSREEAMEWARRFPAPFGEQADGEIEVRALYELDDLGPSESIERFRQLETGRGAR